MTRGAASLLHRGRCQRRRSDDVADGVHVRNGGLAMSVDLDEPTRRFGEPRRFDVQPHQVGDAP